MPSERFRPSVTVAAIVERDGRYLLVEEHTPEGLRLNNPAGHLEPGESLFDAVVREALEETARPFAPEALVGVYQARLRREASGEDISYLRFAFCGTVGEIDAGRALDTGIVRTVWLTAQEVEASRGLHRSPLVWRCIADHRAGRRHPLQLLGTDDSIYAAGPAP
jgi:8-oxo-dGTP pyrophosphatase MutT (NUDIX family)